MSDSPTARRVVLGAGALAGSAFAMIAAAGPASAGLVPSLPPAPIKVPAPAPTTPTCSLTVLTNCYLPGTSTIVKVYVPPAPAPVSSAVGGVTAPLQGPASSLQSAAGGVGGTVGGVAGAVGGAVGTAGAPALGGVPTSGSASTGTGAPGSGPSTATTAAPRTAKAQGATSDNLLGAASAFLPSSLFTSVADLGSTPGSLEAVPSPDLAALPQSRLQDVQAPLLAAAQKSADGSVWEAITGKALPGLLIVLATVVVGLVGAGNLRVWQLRMAARSS